jgi:hypothetical protein
MNKQFNITAQIYEISDPTKQTILINDLVFAQSEEKALIDFYNGINPNYTVMKIYSVEEINI